MSISATTSSISQFYAMAAKAKITASTGSLAAALGKVDATTTSAASSASSITAAPQTEKSSTADAFRDYMKMNPAERMEEAWLKRHGLTKEDLKNMPAEEQAAVRDAMAKDIQAQLEQQAGGKKGTVADILA